MAPASQSAAQDQEDYYTLLAIPATASESEIRRAYRKTSLLYHPDKVTPTPENLAKFQLLQTAIHVLSDAAEKAQYDQTREARLRRQAETAALEGRRRRMKEELERREMSGVDSTAPVGSNGAGAKRSWSEREMEIKRIAEENRKRREAASVRKMQDVNAAENAHVAATAAAKGDDPSQTDTVRRSVKVRWIKEGDGLDIDDIALTEMFPVGDVENALILKDKKRRLKGREHKVVLGTAVLVFHTLAAATKAVLRGNTAELESVEWAAADKEREL